MKSRNDPGYFKRWRKSAAVFLVTAGIFLCSQEILVYSAGENGSAEDNQMSVYEEGQVSAQELDSEELMKIQEQAGEKMLDEFDFSQLDTKLKDLFPKERLRFEDVMSSMMSGDLKDTGKLLLQYIGDQIGYEFQTNRQNLIYMLMIAVIAAVFTNFSGAFQSRQVSEIGFYVLYMLLITMCLTTFRVAMEGLEGKLEALLDFMRLLCPGYFMAVSIAAGSSSSLMFYNLVLILIYLVEVLILRLLLPLINIYIMIQVMNYLAGEHLLTELADLIRKIITWILRTMLGGVVGLNVIQGLLSPTIDHLKRSTLTKAVEAVPALGNVFGGVADVLLGTAVLIKNGIGMAGAVILILICSIPVVQMAAMTMLYKFAAAMVQPVSDKRITGCIRSVSEGYGLMLKVLYTTLILFLITITVIASSTS
ncbi:MAG: stage III sporulation protein AF [Ruminococcus sp.]|jgi:stage III sporulation protein AE|nr:stage III sporulation protein AF [Ruminococcus sp.]